MRRAWALRTIVSITCGSCRWVVSMTDASGGMASGPVDRVASRRSRETMFGEDFIEIDDLTARPQLGDVPAGALVGIGIQINLQFGLRKDHGALIAAFGHDVSPLGADACR